MHKDLKNEVANRQGWEYNPLSQQASIRILSLTAYVYWDSINKRWTAYTTSPGIYELNLDVSDAVSASDALDAVIRCLDAHLNGEEARAAHDRAMAVFADFLTTELGREKANGLLDKFNANKLPHLRSQLGR
jgi:hypothetical protein